VTASLAGERDPEQRTTPVELLWDLVFVFAVTQVTTLLAGSLTWAGFGRAMLVLALIWWAWSAFVWAANAQGETSPALRLVLLPATGFIFVAGLAVPRAFADEATVFACAYAVVRALHIVLYYDASRRGSAAWSAIAGFALTVAGGMVLLIAGSLLHGLARDLLWVAAVAIDYAGPAWLTRERLRGIQHVAVAHFAERYGLFVIICLGESIVSLGVGALGASSLHPHELTAARLVAVSLLLAITVGLWWAYFQRSAAEAERRLAEHPDPVLAAADGYSYLHLPIVAGIIIFAVGARVLMRGAVTAPLPSGPRLALCGGVALYLLAHLAFSLRLGERRLGRRVPAAAAVLIVYALGSGLPGWAVAAAIVGVLALLFAVEAVQAAVDDGYPLARAVTGAMQARAAPNPGARAAGSSSPPAPCGPPRDHTAD
jgi:low temperature requirement protein LtrA